MLNGAVSQYDRWLRALDPGYARVDGRTDSDLLDFAVQYASLIRFYDLSNQPDGDWVQFFLQDPTMALAALGSLDMKAIEADYLALQRATAAERDYPKKFELLRGVFHDILSLARRVNRTLAVFAVLPPSVEVTKVRAELVRAIDTSQRPALQKLKAYDEGAGLPDALREAIGLDYQGFLPVWDLGCVCPDGSIYRGATRQRKINHALPCLDPLFYAFYDAIVDAQTFARGNLQSTVLTGDHKPQIALYMAFVQLFRSARNTLNTFSSRYVDFYYRRVLRETPAGPLPDNVYLTFTLAQEEGVDRTTVPRGTLFPAGQDPDGQEILYAADRALTVTSATIAKLYTIRIQDVPPGSGAPGRVLQAGISPDTATPWPTFGTDRDPPAELGFALSSPYLLLTGGERETWITFDYEGAAVGEMLAALERMTGLSRTDILETILEQAFALYGTTTGGWFEIGPYDVSVPGERRFTLHFQLPATAPPFTMYGDSEEEPKRTTPTRTSTTLGAWLLQKEVALTDSVRVLPFSLLSGMLLTGFEIRTTVDGLSDITIENTDGVIDASAPFAIFGGLPVVGSYVQVRSIELFAKRPETITLTVDWFSLPPNEDGFQGWYRDYVIGPSGAAEPDLFDNTTFKGEIDVVQPGWWGVATVSPPGPNVDLFRTTNDCFDVTPRPDGTLCTFSAFGGLDVVPLQPPAYYTPEDSALRLRLSEPSYAFGNSIYSINVLSAVLADLPDAALCQTRCLIACAPLKDASRWIGECLARCPVDTPDDQCLQPCLTNCVDRILALAGSPHNEMPQAVRQQLLDTVSCLDACLASPLADLRQCAGDCQAELDGAYSSVFNTLLNACLEPKKDLKYPNDPWLPMAQSVRIDYTAWSSEGTLYHLLPFGGYDTVPLPAPLLPQFSYQGALYLGFTGLVTPETLTMLAQFTSEEQPVAEPVPVTWEYLAGNAWTPLQPDQFLADTTNALRNTGMLAMALPAYDGDAHTVMPPDCQWLRATVARNASTFPKTASIVPHVTTATWQAGTSSGASLGTPLPAGTISSSVQDLPYIDSITQPIASFGGRPPEDERAFEIRLGERLRHKDRAILGWDYDRLVLERFPTIWKSATLPPAVPGKVTVVVVPGSQSVEVVDPTAPRAPGYVLARIRCYLETLSSPFVDIAVVNPQYVRIRVIAAVEFNQDATAGSNIDRLNDDLVQYLSPWFYDVERAEKRGRYATEDEISEFIQTRPYVESLQTLAFAYDRDPAGMDWYFLTSQTAHDITEVPTPVRTSCR